MSRRDQFRVLQEALGVPITGIPNDESKAAWQSLWDATLREYRKGDGEKKSDKPASAIFVIGADHWLQGVKRDFLPGGGTLDPKCLVIHFTAGASGASSIDYWRNRGNGVGAHLVIERDGTVIQCRSFDRTCGHAGVSRWVNPSTGKKVDGVNSCSIGIELANAGDSDISWAKKQPGYAEMRARHRNGQPERTWEAYSTAQLAACREVAKAIVGHYKLVDVTGHDCIAPERKSDPGPAFPMAGLRAACGFTGLPAVHRS